MNATTILMIGWLSLAMVDPSVEVTGIGRTVADAKLDARQHALEGLQARLATHDPPLSAWQPTLVDIERLVQGPGRAGKSVESVPGVGVHIQWIVPIREMTEDEILQRDRRAAREQEAGVVFLIAMTGLAVGVAGIALRSRVGASGRGR
ncbi:MAG TPA: hypothetical protein VHR72_10565 [Gemmataceae bacterium]|nr:hypothetical protein [Gemmataceae bacterium]